MYAYSACLCVCITCLNTRVYMYVCMYRERYVCVILFYKLIQQLLYYDKLKMWSMLTEKPYTSNKIEWVFKILKQFLKFFFHRSMEQNTDPDPDTHNLAQLTFFKQLFILLLLLKN